MPETKPISVAEIKINGGTQPRCEIDDALVSEYAEAMRAGEQFPPVVVFEDGVGYWLADGFHRTHAARRAGVESIEAEIHQGTKRDAILYSVGANAAHGQRRTNADKRKAVMTLLEDEEWSGFSNDWIAEKAAVSIRTVERYRASITTDNVGSEQPATRTYTTKHGTTSTMNTENIGKRKPSAHTTSNGIERKPLEERVKEIADLAHKGHSGDQIADEIGIHVHRVREIARDNGITIPDEAFKKSHKINPSRVIDETVNGLEGYAMGLKSLIGEIGGIEKSDAERWHESIGESVKQFNALKRKLKEIINE